MDMGFLSSFYSSISAHADSTRYDFASPENRSERRKLPPAYSIQRYRRYHCPIVLLSQVWLNRNGSRCTPIELRERFCEGEHTMSELMTKSLAHEQQEQRLETRTALERIAGFTMVATAVALLAVLVATTVYAKDKYSLKSPGGIAFSNFRGYEDWAFVSSARTDEVLKVIVANPIMIKAFKAGIPGNGQPFPDGSKIAKLQWKPKKSTEAPFVVDVPDVFTQAFVMEKDSKRFLKDDGGWGYAVFNYEAASDKFTADPSPVNCGTKCHVAVKAKDYIFHPYQKR